VLISGTKAFYRVIIVFYVFHDLPMTRKNNAESDGAISALTLADGYELYGNFYIDCSGSSLADRQTL
jgi:hypothetical protein